MTEPHPLYAVIDPEHLTTEQVAQLRFVLSVLSLHELEQIAAKVKDVCLEPGIGRVYITIEHSHPMLIGTDIAEKLEKEVIKSE